MTTAENRKVLLKVMIDIECISTANNAGILAIGATTFDYPTLRQDVYYEKASLASVEAAGFDISEETLFWWTTQNDDVREETFSGKVEIETVMIHFAEWLEHLKHLGYELAVFSNGSVFDLVILRNAFDRFGITVPWNFRKEYCYRTITSMLPLEFKAAKSEVHNETKHSALADAGYQAKVLTRIFAMMRGQGNYLWEL